MNEALNKGGDGSRLVLPVGAHDHAQGSAAAAVTLLEYGDFECEHCAEAFPVVALYQKPLNQPTFATSADSVSKV